MYTMVKKFQFEIFRQNVRIAFFTKSQFKFQARNLRIINKAIKTIFYYQFTKFIDLKLDIQIILFYRTD